MENTTFISNNQKVKEYSLNHGNKYITTDDFIAEIQEKGSFEIESGDILYIDVDYLEDDIYNVLSAALADVSKFISSSGDIRFDGDIEDYSEKLNNPAIIENNNENHIQDREFKEEVQKPIHSEPERVNYDTTTGFDTLYQESVVQSEYLEDEDEDNKEAEVFVFGSSKGGSGKTFTCLLSAYNYAKQNPHKKIAVADFDIIDGQIGVTIHKFSPTIFNYYKHWVKEQDSDHSSDLSLFKVSPEFMPHNLDFYLASKDHIIKEDKFWNDVFKKLIVKYDRVYFDTGIDYMNHHPIYTLYKIADKIMLTSTANLRSVGSVLKQIQRLKGLSESNGIFSEEDEIESKLNLVITQANLDSKYLAKTINQFEKIVNVIGVFGYMPNEIEKAEIERQWYVFDDNQHVQEILNKINS